MCVYMFMFMYMHMYLYWYFYMYLVVRICICTCIYAFVYVYVLVYVYFCLFLHLYMICRSSMYTYVHTYIDIHMSREPLGCDVARLVGTGRIPAFGDARVGNRPCRRRTFPTQQCGTASVCCRQEAGSRAPPERTWFLAILFMAPTFGEFVLDEGPFWAWG